MRKMHILRLKRGDYNVGLLEKLYLPRPTGSVPFGGLKKIQKQIRKLFRPTHPETMDSTRVVVRLVD
jgi:hypothetical protein